jgi:hypothetical protein
MFTFCRRAEASTRIPEGILLKTKDFFFVSKHTERVGQSDLTNNHIIKPFLDSFGMDAKIRFKYLSSYASHVSPRNKQGNVRIALH